MEGNLDFQVGWREAIPPLVEEIAVEKNTMAEGAKILGKFWSLLEIEGPGGESAKRLSHTLGGQQAPLRRGT